MRYWGMGRTGRHNKKEIKQRFIFCFTYKLLLPFTFSCLILLTEVFLDASEHKSVTYVPLIQAGKCLMTTFSTGN